MECHNEDIRDNSGNRAHFRTQNSIFIISQTISTAFTVGSVNMSSFQAVKKAVTIAPTVRTLPTGVPNAPFLNFVARAPSHGHGDHGHSSGSRSDKPARFVGSMKTTSSGLVSKTFVGAYHQIRPMELF
jgi:C4-dicarboxylate transporter